MIQNQTKISHTKNPYFGFKIAVSILGQTLTYKKLLNSLKYRRISTSNIYNFIRIIFLPILRLKCLKEAWKSKHKKQSPQLLFSPGAIGLFFDR